MILVPLAAALVVLATYPVAPASAQANHDFPRTTRAAGAAIEPETAALLRLGNLYRTGRGVPVDAERAIGYFRQAAAGGDPVALIALADALVTLQPGQADGGEVVAAYERAAAAGTTEALPLLGDFHSDGKVVPVDLERAYRYYLAAAEAKDVRGRLRVAEMLATGEGIAADPDTGLAMLHDLAGKGSGSAMLSLGDIYSTGGAGLVDGAQAVHFLELAAEAGRPEALVKLGRLYLEGTVVPRRARLAEAYLDRAAAVGYPAGLYALGVGYLNGELPGTVSAAHGLLAAAADSGSDDASVSLAGAQLRGIGIERDVEAALAGLVAARDSGNLPAGTHLVGIYRDGVLEDGTVLVRRDIAAAEAHLESIAHRLDHGALLHETLLLAAARGTGRAFVETVSRFDELSTRDQASTLSELLRVNPNAYVHLIQSRLVRLGYYSGQPTGMLDRRTIAALNRLCVDRGIDQICRIGPLRQPVARALATAFRSGSTLRQASGS